MTDGTIFLFPAAPGASGTGTEDHRNQMADKGGFGIASSTVIEAKGFNAHDGTGFSLARLGGLKAAIITKRISETVALRARDLRIEHVYQGQQDKAAAFYEILEKEKLAADEVAYVGDDIIDLPVMRLCGLAIAVKNSREGVRREAWNGPSTTISTHGARIHPRRSSKPLPKNKDIQQSDAKMTPPRTRPKMNQIEGRILLATATFAAMCVK